MNKILIIENNANFRDTLKNLLQSQFPEMALEEAKSGHEALQKATDFHPDIVFMDIKLPMEAAAIIRKLKNIVLTVTIVLFTDYDPIEYRSATEEGGADYILQKGASTAQEIVGLVDSILDFTHPFPIKKSSPNLTKIGK
jgi:DNA-binding NarL/FixJ family response regulator